MALALAINPVAARKNTATPKNDAKEQWAKRAKHCACAYRASPTS
jgi:hypothetical protein